MTFRAHSKTEYKRLVTQGANVLPPIRGADIVGMKYKNIETVKKLDFDRLDMLVSERIGALKLLAQGMGERQVNDDICRDLILPCVYTLAQFLESVKIEEKNGD